MIRAIRPVAAARRALAVRGGTDGSVKSAGEDSCGRNNAWQAFILRGLRCIAFCAFLFDTHLFWQFVEFVGVHDGLTEKLYIAPQV